MRTLFYCMQLLQFITLQLNVKIMRFSADLRKQQPNNTLIKATWRPCIFANLFFVLPTRKIQSALFTHFDLRISHRPWPSSLIDQLSIYSATPVNAYPLFISRFPQAASIIRPQHRGTQTEGGIYQRAFHALRHRNYANNITTSFGEASPFIHVYWGTKSFRMFTLNP